MSPIRYRDDSESDSRGSLFLAVGALAGLAAGVLIAQRFGGFSGLSARVRGRFARRPDEVEDAEGETRQRLSASEFEGAYAEEEDELDDAEASPDAVLEERVLEAFRNDPILSERAVDIGAVGDGIIELTGWVHAEEEAAHAVTLTRGVPGVDTVVNRLAVREEEEQLDDNARRFQDGDPALTEARWEGQRVGTGRRRQGTSAEADRHADPKPNLEDRWLSEREALQAAAEETENIAERRRRKAAPKGGRTDGSPVAPTGVPKTDHVAEPDSEEARQVMREQTGRDTLRAD